MSNTQENALRALAEAAKADTEMLCIAGPLNGHRVPLGALEKMGNREWYIARLNFAESAVYERTAPNELLYLHTMSDE